MYDFLIKNIISDLNARLVTAKVLCMRRDSELLASRATGKSCLFDALDGNHPKRDEMTII